MLSRTLSGDSADTITNSGRNDTNALAANAIERSTNSTSSSRDHILPSVVTSSRWAYRAADVRARSAMVLVVVLGCSVTS